MTGSATLVLPSHGTGDPSGQQAIRGLVDAVAARLDIPVVECFVDVQEPDVPTTLASIPGDGPLIIAPLLLSTGYHVRVDIAEAAQAVAPRVTVTTPALGPDDRLVQLLERRLRDAGLGRNDLIVLAAAGSSDPDAVADCRLVAQNLGERLGVDVSVGFLASAHPRVNTVIGELREAHPGRRIAVATYLLAPGYFARLAAESDADLVSGPLLEAESPPPDALVEIVLDRARAGGEKPVSTVCDDGDR
ncbi:MAG: CbiX/SirB N-terminal domain-containing protein [Leifsonia sp.]